MVANSNKPMIPYLRQSRRKERTISIDEQRRDITRWAKENGVKLGAEVIEQGVSGSKAWRERGLGAAIRACEEGRAAGIIVAWQDRLSRENGLSTGEVWQALEQAGARLVCAAEGLDTATGDQEMNFSLKAIIAREQWKRYRANFQRAKHQAWEKGYYVGSAPLGYARAGQSIVKNGSEAVVKEAFQLRAGGAGWGRIAQVLDVTRNGARRLIQNTVYKGVIGCTCGCGEERRDADLAMVAPSVWAKAQPREGDPLPRGSEPRIVKRYDLAEGVTTSPNPNYKKPEGDGRPLGRAPGTGESLLSGLARCAGCQLLMQTGSTTTSSGRRLRFYRCPSTPKRCPDRATCSAEPVERFVIEEAYRRLGGRVDRPEVDLTPLQTAAEVAEAELRAFTLNTPATTPGYADAVAARAAALSAAQDALEEARQASGGSTHFTEAYLKDVFDAEHVDITLKQATLRELIPGGIVIKRGRNLPVEEKVAL